METPAPILSEDMGISLLLREMERDYGSLRKLAKALNMSPAGVSRLKNEKQRPAVSSCVAIARVSGKSLDEVIAVAYGMDARDIG